MGKHLNRYVKPLRYADGVAYVPLTRGLEAKISVEDADLIGRWKWRALRPSRTGSIYAARSSVDPDMPSTIMLHRAILGFPAGWVTFEDRDGLNCMRSNLLVKPPSAVLGRRPYKSGAAGFRGVRAVPSGRFDARLKVDGREAYIGTFDTAQAASDAWKAAAMVARGEIGPTRET